MRKRKPQRQPIPTRTTWGDRFKVAHYVLGAVFTSVKIGAWVWAHWPFI